MKVQTLTNRLLAGEFPTNITIEDLQSTTVLTFAPDASVHLNLLRDKTTGAYQVIISAVPINLNGYQNTEILFSD